MLPRLLQTIRDSMTFISVRVSNDLTQCMAYTCDLPRTVAHACFSSARLYIALALACVLLLVAAKRHILVSQHCRGCAPAARELLLITILL